MRDIPQNCDPAPIIRIYVDLNLQTLHKAGVISGPVPVPDAAAEPAPPSSSTVPAQRSDSAPLGSMKSAGGSSGQLAQTVPAEATGRTASGAAETSPLSSAGSMASPGSQASQCCCSAGRNKELTTPAACLHAQVQHTTVVP